MKIIDAHIHLSRITSFQACAERESRVDYTAEGYEREAEEQHIEQAVCMGLAETVPGGFPDASAKTPMLADLCDCLPENVRLCPGINPHTLNARTLGEMEERIRAKNSKIVGFKLYAGYYHADIFDPVYAPVLHLAAKYNLAVAVHMGDTYSDRGLLSYAHPLNADRLAVQHGDVRIVICHLGVPWVFDACEAALKNKNVYVDLSGMYVGSAEAVRRASEKQLSLDRYRQALEYLDNYDKVLFGTDWPLAPMGAYIDFVKKIVPAEEHDKVFSQNAARVYRMASL